MEALLGLGISIGALLFAGIVGIFLWVFMSLAHMKALNALGYDKAWIAWIPYVSYYGLADAVCESEEKVTLFGKFEIPSILFKLWWILPLVLVFLPLGNAYALITRVIYVIFLGCTYAKMYARLDGKTEQETQVFGCVSGFIPLIAACKFIAIKK